MVFSLFKLAYLGLNGATTVINFSVLFRPLRPG